MAFMRGGAAAVELSPPPLSKAQYFDVRSCRPGWNENVPTQFGRLAAAVGAWHACVVGQDVLTKE